MPARMTLRLYFWQLIAGLLFSLLIAGPAWADAYFWTGPVAPASGDWDDSTNWTGGSAYPGLGDDFTIPNNLIINLNGDQAADTMTANASVSFSGGNLQVGSLRANTGATINMNGNALITYSGTLTGGASGISVDISDWQIHETCNISTAGTLSLPGTISGNGNLNITGGGTVTFGGTYTYTGSTIIDSGTLELGRVLSSTSYQINNGGTLQLNRTDALPNSASISIASGALFDMNGYNETIDTLSGGGTVDTTGVLNLGDNNGSSTFSGDIIGNGTLWKEGTGTLTLTGDLGSTQLRVYEGTLVFNGQSIDRIYAGTPGILKGIGTTTSSVEIWSGAEFGPGQSIGTFTCRDLEMSVGSTLTIEVSGASADQVVVTNVADLTTPDLNITGTPKKGATFTIINTTSAAPVSGSFSGLSEGDTFTRNGYQYQITYAGGTGNNDIVLTALTGSTDPTPTPEPEPEPTPAPKPRPAPDIGPGDSPSPTGSLDGTALSWPRINGASSYRIYRADCPTCPRKEIGETTENSFVDNTAIPGQPYTYWLRAVSGGRLSGFSSEITAWRYEQNPGRAGDFNGDGVADLLWWDQDTGLLSIWYMSGGQVTDVSSPMQGLDISQWLLIGTADFNGDGACDLLWWKPETGEILLWHMQPGIATAGASFLAMNQPIPQTMHSNAALSYYGDLNGDHITDILWRDYVSGEITIWLMGDDGKPMLAGPPVPSDDGICNGERPCLSGSLEWQVAGLADADGDGLADVIWQDQRNNRLVIWLMDGVSVMWALENNGSLDTAWRLAGVGDLNMDRQADIVWRNDTSGAVKIWLMKKCRFMAERIMLEGSEEATQWQVKAVGDFRAPGCDDVYFKQSETGSAMIVTLDGQQFTPSVE